MALVARVDDWIGREEGPLNRLAQGLLRRIQLSRCDPVWKYLQEIQHDQGAMLQLTPEGIDFFDAAVVDRPGIDYGCVVAAVPRPRFELSAASLFGPEYLALRSLFRLLHGLTARPHRHYRVRSPTARRSVCSTARSGSAPRRKSTTAWCRR